MKRTLAFTDILTFRGLSDPYRPRPEERAFLERAEVRQDDELAVLDNQDAERFFGVPLARRGPPPGKTSPFHLQLPCLSIKVLDASP